MKQLLEILDGVKFFGHNERVEETTANRKVTNENSSDQE